MKSIKRMKIIPEILKTKVEKNPPKKIIDAEDLKFKTIRQMIVRAKMEEKPLLVVEGSDDVAVYELFAKHAGKKVDVRAIETISGYGEGCFHVRKFMGDAQSIIGEAPDNEKFIRGIVDRDATFFRGEDYSHLKCLFTLNAYSFESHFTTEEHVKHLLYNILQSRAGVDNRVINYVMGGIVTAYQELFLISLEALKGACISTYDSTVSYSWTYGQIKHGKTEVIAALKSKTYELRTFAQSRNITVNEVKYVAKGKWLFHTFLESVYGRIKTLSKKCSQGNGTVVRKCPYCIVEKHEKCSWKLKKRMSVDLAELIILQYIDERETKYIVDEIKKLG